MKRAKQGERVQELSTGKVGTVATTYNDQDGAAWVNFPDGTSAVLYPEEFEVVK
jgi:hypothetical protein